MHLRRFITVVLLAALSLPVFPAENPIGYRLEVKGMACAFCAYRTTKQLATLSGIEGMAITGPEIIGPCQIISVNEGGGLHWLSSPSGPYRAAVWRCRYSRATTDWGDRGSSSNNRQPDSRFPRQ